MPLNLQLHLLQISSRKKIRRENTALVEMVKPVPNLQKQVTIVQPVQMLPQMLPTTGKNFIFKPIDPAEIEDIDDELPSLSCDKILTISSDPDLEESMLKLESKAICIKDK